PLSTSRLRIRPYPYLGARVLRRPAPNGIPLIPLRLNAAGELEGVPELKGVTPSHNLGWYRYCSHEAAPGLDPDFTDDNVLRYYNAPAKVQFAAKELGHPLWYAGRLEERMRASQFPGVDFGAPFRWRSEGQEQNNIITGIVIRIDPARLGGRPVEKFLARDADSGAAFIAFCSFCSHMCCVPGYAESSQAGPDLDKVLCTCHGSLYDPRDIRQFTGPPDR
ncbi:MAG TPA: hypothetical protein VI893_07135, partial [Thermoplasmata archaeon]|nr:hypothetical protein [Thermoplasmata archaeon]